MAAASDTASSRRASGERPSSRRSFGGRLEVGWMTSARPEDAADEVDSAVCVDVIELGLFTLFVRLEELHRLCRHHRGDRVLVDELGMGVPAQQHAEIVEPGDDALQLHSVYQEHRDRGLVLAHIVQEYVLNVLCLFCGHGVESLIQSFWSQDWPDDAD